MKYKITIALFLLTCLNASAQTQQNLRYNRYSYAKAVELLEQKRKPTVNEYRVLAESYKGKEDYPNAEATYAQVVNSAQKQPEDVYAYAQLLKMNEKYPQAMQEMDKYAQLRPQERRSLLYRQNEDYVSELLKDKKQFTVTHLAINSSQQDFSAVYKGNKVVYVTSRKTTGMFAGKNRNNETFFRLYEGDEGSNGEIENKKVMSFFKGKYNIGPVSYSRDGNVLFYTENNFSKDSSGIRHLLLYESRLKDGEWSEPVAFYLNNKNYSVGHPALNTNGTILYFASDMPGGKGGVDLYRSVRNADGSWGPAENLGDGINTEGNEMFPYLHDNGLFFFSSDGFPGLGGLDVFSAEMKRGALTDVMNLGVPVNGSKDDFGFVLNATGTKGFFASNRPGGEGEDDLYSFHVAGPLRLQRQIHGNVEDLASNDLEGVRMTLEDPATGHVIDSTYTDVQGNYELWPDKRGEYVVRANKEDYTEGMKNASVRDEPIEMDLKMEPDKGVALYFLVSDKINRQPLPSVRLRIVEPDNNGRVFVNDITSSAGDLRIPLEGKKKGDRLKYRVRLDKEGYVPREFIFEYVIPRSGDINVMELLASNGDMAMEKIELGVDIGKMMSLNPIYYDLGKYEVDTRSAVELDKIIQVMNDNPTLKVALRSHTDCRGTAASNKELSNKRAKAAAAYIRKYIKNPQRISGEGLGESKSINGCYCEGKQITPCSEKEYQENRRTEFIIQHL